MDLYQDEELKRLEEESAAQADKKGLLRAFGGALDGLQSVPSAHEMLYNGKSTAPTASKVLGGVADSMSDPMERKAKAYAYLKSRREGQAGLEEDSYKKSLKDENSNAAKAYKLMLINAGLPRDLVNNTSAYDLHTQGYSPSKLSEIQSKAAIDFESAKKLKQMEIKGQLDKVDLENSTPKKQFDNLPEDKKLTISELAKKNAFKTSIKNQIDATLAQWDNLSDDQKVARGRQLLKTLNSTEGSDAVGAQEAAMLGAKLEYAMGNFFNSQPMQFGRDLKGFKEQARGTSQAIGDAISANQAVIDQSYGREASSLAPVAAQPQISPLKMAIQEEKARRARLKNTAAK